MRPLEFPNLIFTSIAAMSLLSGHAESQKEVSFSGGAAVSLGRIENSSDISSVNYNGSRLQTVSAQLLVKALYNDNLTVAAGFGILEKHFPVGRSADNGGRTPFVWLPYPVEADLNYSWWNAPGAKLAVTAGYFPYSYNPDVKNLGLYLLRGPVYPGILISGFEIKHTRPVANNLGLRVQHISGNFEQNLIINSETETYPLFDFSPAYIANFSFGKALKIGAGVNFEHLIPVDNRLTNPDTVAYDGSDSPPNFSGDPNERTQIYVNPVTQDTTYLSFAGTKLMADASFDPKAFLSSDAFGPEDLKIYGEVALIGLDMKGPYKQIYGDYMHRMPVMMGFNFPTFKLLDHLSLEAEWYGAKFKDDLARYQSTTSNLYSPLPVVNSANVNLTRDNWKWSLHAAKTIGHLRFSAQVANDHSRPGGTYLASGSEWEVFTVTPKDWYWMAKAGFFF